VLTAYLDARRPPAAEARAGGTGEDSPLGAGAARQRVPDAVQGAAVLEGARRLPGLLPGKRGATTSLCGGGGRLHALRGHGATGAP